ncbi:MAG: hypothetical protein FD149_1826 [Rhodospirillaceae bacterium]|nr:MAG: hypothetical protein FD149_1826 [Rhodospirillaceae bacterium]
MEHKITALVRPTLEGMGYALVRVLLQGKERRTVQIMAERQDRAAMSVDDCVLLSRAVSAVLDVADPVVGSYVLEVSSPGLDRPLTRREDFNRFAGHETRLETVRPIGGQRRFRGRLLGLTEEGAVRLALPEGEEVVVPQADVAKAKLVIGDEPIAKRRK